MCSVLYDLRCRRIGHLRATVDRELDIVYIRDLDALRRRLCLIWMQIFRTELLPTSLMISPSRVVILFFFLDKPEDVRLRPDITNSKVCAEYTVNLTCSADANPAVNNYTLFEDDSVVNTSSLGVWSITMNKAGQFVYRCEANNSVGFGKSNDINVNVEGELRWQPRLLFYMFSFSLP